MRRQEAVPISRLVLWALVGWLVASFHGEASQAEGPASFRVRYRSADAVYLEAGKRAGLRVGDRLEVARGGEVVAVIEIVFAAEHSSSARPIEGQGEIRAGDFARPLGELRPPAGSEGPSDVGGVAERNERPTMPPSERPRRRANRLSGVASIGWERFRDTSGKRDVDRTTGRLSLRGRDLGGRPLDLRVRLRSRRVERDRPFAGGAPAREDRDRLYELSLRWAPSSGHFDLELGRLGAGAFTGIGYLDGASGSFRLRPGWQLGAFVGRRPELAELGFDSEGAKYGLFSRWSPASGGPWEVFVAGVHEEDAAGLSRRLAVVETKLGRDGGRWSLYQRAEVDLDRDGTVSGQGDDSRLTQLALVASGRLGERSRLVLSYDRYDPLLLFEDQAGPAERFEGLLREGLRVRLLLGREGGLSVALTAGVREGEGKDDSTSSFGVGVHSARFRGFSLGGDLLGFSNPTTEGTLATLRARYGLAAGHTFDLTLGTTIYSEDLGVLGLDIPDPGSTDRDTSWVRLAAWVELPASLFARGELEITEGDDGEGERLSFGFGYRF